MKRLTVLVATFVLLAQTAFAAISPQEVRSIASEAGLPETVPIKVVVDANPNVMNGGFVTGYCTPWFCIEMPPEIVLFQGANVPDEFMRWILVHEIAHYHQWKAGYLPTPNAMQVEWLADEFAARFWCQDKGVDLRGLFQRLLLWLWGQFGYRGDAAHGELLDRMENSAALCGQPEAA